MRLVAIEAIFHYRRVLPQKRTPPLGMALVAVLVGRAFDQLLRVGRAVGIVAIGAGDLPLAKRHVRGAHKLRAPHWVALKANLDLGALDELPVLGQGLGKTDC